MTSSLHAAIISYLVFLLLMQTAFSVRTVKLWNSLPNKVIEADTVDTFKRRLDTFWADQDIVYNYKANLTGLTSRSHINI